MEVFAGRVEAAAVLSVWAHSIVVISRRPGPAIRTVNLVGGLCVSNVDSHRILCSMGSEGILD